MSKLKGVAVIVVVYNPHVTDVCDRISNYDAAVDHVYIIDNSSKNQEKEFYKESRKNVTYVALQSNKGIAYAQNFGAHLAMDHGYPFLLFFDQDSYIKGDEIKGLLSAAIANDEVACASPSSTNKTKYSSETISSGSLIPSKKFEIVGDFQEQLFIDFVDYEWCWRANAMGYRILEVAGVRLIHQIGSTNYRVGKLVSAPFRNYYYYRNFLFLLKSKSLNTKQSRKWMIKALKHTIFELGFSPHRIKRLKYIFDGIRDGLSGHMGIMEGRDGN